NSLSYLYVGAFDNVRFFNKTSDQLYENSRILGSNQIQYLTGISFRSLLSNGLWNINLSRTFYDFDTSQRDTTLNYIFLNKSREGENNLSSDIILKLSSSSEINFGGNLKFIRFKGEIKLPNFVSSFGDTLNLSGLNARENFWKAGFFTNYSDLFFARLRVNLGFRFDYFDAIEEKFVFSPRFSASYLLNDLSEINLSLGIYHQAPSYLWLIASEKNKELKNIRAEQLVLGFSQRLRYDINLKLEGYYKNYKNYPASTTRPYLVLANTGAGFAGSDDNFSSFGLEPLISEGKGFSRGFELLLQKKASEIPHYGIMSLTYSETYFTALDGIQRRGSYDQKWIFNISAGYYFNEKWEASLKFRYSTGKPYTPFNTEGKQSVDDYNSKRLSDNHSLDLRVDRRWNFEKWNLIVYLDVQNIYNRKNVSFVRWDAKEKKVIESRSIGILPSIGICAEL
ncbi:MAG: TonB-dependent receptor, partial [Ignavibacteria bacterium]|nr:TonB-dependent receptor [Ignavibacteria bacterium]